MAIWLNLILTISVLTAEHYDDVKCAIYEKLSRNEMRDGPVLVRLAWHASGVYGPMPPIGGSNGGRIRFPPESTDPDSNGLQRAVKWLEPIKEQYPNVTFADIITLSGATAVESAGGPYIPWRGGRFDAHDGTDSPPNGRLPDGQKGVAEIHRVFDRLGFNASDTVALIGAHVLGECHAEFSGFKGQWTRNKLKFSNDFFRTVLREQWGKATPAQKEQFLNLNGTGPFMMLPSDLALLDVKEYSEPFRLYADDQKRFFDAFATAFGRLLELGIEPPLQGDYVSDLSICKRSASKQNKCSNLSLNKSLIISLALFALSLYN